MHRDPSVLNVKKEKEKTRFIINSYMQELCLFCAYSYTLMIEKKREDGRKKNKAMFGNTPI